MDVVWSDNRRLCVLAYVVNTSQSPLKGDMSSTIYADIHTMFFVHILCSEVGLQLGE